MLFNKNLDTNLLGLYSKFMVAYLEKQDEVLVLHLLHEVTVEMAQNGDAEVDLVVDAEYCTDANVLADLRPVEVVQEALAYPLLADLCHDTSHD